MNHSTKMLQHGRSTYSIRLLLLPITPDRIVTAVYLFNPLRLLVLISPYRL